MAQEEGDPLPPIGGFSGFISGLWDALKMGAQNTGAAISEDVSNVRAGQMPRNIARDLPGLISMLSQPSINPTIPAQTMSKMAFDPQRGWYEVSSKTYPGGDWLSMMAQTGGFGELVQKIMRGFQDVP